MNTDPQPTNKPTTYRSDGPLGALLNHIPLESRLALTAGVVVGVIASVVAGGIDTLAGQIALGLSIAVGLCIGIILPLRATNDRRERLNS